MRDGSVPLRPFIPVIKRVKEELGLKILVHTGIPHDETIKALADTGIDGVLLDVIGSDDTIREVYNLNRKVEDLDRALTLLEEHGIPVILHIVVGLHYGILKGERKAMEIVSKHSVAALVIVVLMPLPGTDMEKVNPPHPITVARLIATARLIKEDTPLLLGCARPGGIHRIVLDALSIRAGVNGIAYPSIEARLIAGKLGLNIEFHRECCSLIWKYISIK